MDIVCRVWGWAMAVKLFHYHHPRRKLFIFRLEIQGQKHGYGKDVSSAPES